MKSWQQWLGRLLEAKKPRFTQVFVDILLLISSFYFAFWIRNDFVFNRNLPAGFLFAVITYVCICVAIGYAVGIYSKKFIFASIEEIFAINTQAFIGLICTLILRLNTDIWGYPRSLPVVASILFVFFSLALRLTYRIARNRYLNFSGPGSRVIIFGAGTLGAYLADLVTLDKNFSLMGYIDDDSRKSELTIRGKKVLGTSDQLENIIKLTKADQLIIAISDLPPNKVDKIKEVANRLNLKLRIIPSASQLILGVESLQDLITFNESSILGREEIAINRDAIASLLRNKVILITGAGGSIGSEIARQCAEYSPAKLYFLDRDESALHALELSLYGTGLMTSSSIILADIRDEHYLDEQFRKIMPNIVFHAAALKHLPILEKFPEEAWKTNVIGTKNVLKASENSNVEILINISTDKAAAPTSVLGQTKLEAEKLTSASSFNSTLPNRKYLSVRFGNVIGSRGSVLHTFKYQIDNDLPVTITHPEVTRYFMTTKEAVSLVLQSAVEGESGETLILDMGQPVKILDVAKFMIKQSGKDLPIEITGLREGEKLHEILSSSTEKLSNHLHPKIFHAKVDDVE
jgi:FlaA1/EpsC-like NDP-sugar epimerase